MVAYNISNLLLTISAGLLFLFPLQKFKVGSLQIKLLAFYGLCSLIFSGLQRILIELFNAAYLNESGNVFVLLEFIFFVLIFYRAYKVNYLRFAVLATMIIYVILYVLVFIFYQDLSYSIIRFGRDMGLIIFSLSYFYYLIKYMPDENLLGMPMFWISAVVIIHFSFTLIISFIMNYTMRNFVNEFLIILYIRNFIRVLFYISLFLISYFELGKHKLVRQEA